MNDLLSDPKNTFSLFARYKKTLFLLLTFLAGIFLLYPTLDYQILLSQGDHGRDLYAFKKTLDGSIPYRDYWWVYGPLMPYYYALFYKLLGTNILSILLAKNLLILFSGALFYLILATIVTPVFAFLGALWFFTFNPDFFFTYNHIGGIFMTLAVTYGLFSYIREQKAQYLFGTLACIFLLMFIKINFGFTALICFLATVYTVDRIYKNPLTRQKVNIYSIALAGLPVLTFLIYFFLFSGLPLYVVRQCLPYFKADHPNSAPMWQSARFYTSIIFKNMGSSWINILFAFLILLSFVQTIYLTIKKQFTARFQKQLLLSLSLLAFFFLINMHEFLASSVLYRTFWSKPFTFLIIFILLATAAKKFSVLIRFLFYAVISLILILTNVQNIQTLKRVKQPWQYLSADRGKVFIGNHARWTDSVMKASQFLDENLRQNETFFAMPYAPLYYFLTGKDSPTRQLIFFEHINIPPEQERKIISEIEDKQVNWILLTNRSDSTEEGLGTFGKTYCPIIADYIDNHFDLVAEFGDWVNPPGWGWNHGTRIFKRRTE